MLLEGADLDSHREALATLAKQHFPPSQVLVMLDREGDSGIGLQCAAVLRTFPPFYRKGQERGWWNRLVRRFIPPEVPWIQIEIPKG